MKLDTTFVQPPNSEHRILSMPNRDGMGMGSMQPLYEAHLAYTEIDHEAGTAFIVKNRRDGGLRGEVTLEQLRNEFFEVMMLDIRDHMKILPVK
jgi:hypothetical protein